MFKVIQLNKTVLDDVKEWLIIRVGGVIEAELDFCTVQSLYCPFAKNNLPNVLKKRTRKCIKKKNKTWHTCILFIFYRYLQMPTQVLHQYKKRKKHRCEHARWVQKKKKAKASNSWFQKPLKKSQNISRVFSTLLTISWPKVVGLVSVGLVLVHSKKVLKYGSDNKTATFKKRRKKLKLIWNFDIIFEYVVCLWVE